MCVRARARARVCSWSRLRGRHKGSTLSRREKSSALPGNRIMVPLSSNPQPTPTEPTRLQSYNVISCFTSDKKSHICSFVLGSINSHRFLCKMIRLWRSLGRLLFYFTVPHRWVAFWPKHLELCLEWQILVWPEIYSDLTSVIWVGFSQPRVSASLFFVPTFTPLVTIKQVFGELNVTWINQCHCVIV